MKTFTARWDCTSFIQYGVKICHMKETKLKS
jgi:hypothetical protein